MEPPKPMVQGRVFKVLGKPGRPRPARILFFDSGSRAREVWSLVASITRGIRLGVRADDVFIVLFDPSDFWKVCGIKKKRS